MSGRREEFSKKNRLNYASGPKLYIWVIEILRYTKFEEDRISYVEGL